LRGLTGALLRPVVLGAMRGGRWTMLTTRDHWHICPVCGDGWGPCATWHPAQETWIPCLTCSEAKEDDDADQDNV
jgi:hypothetical protein